MNSPNCELEVGVQFDARNDVLPDEILASKCGKVTSLEPLNHH